MKFTIFLILVLSLFHLKTVSNKIYNKEIETVQNQSQEQRTDYSDVVETIKYIVQSENSSLHHASYNRLAYLVDTYGSRLWGSQQLELVIDELIQMGLDAGFDQVYKDPVTNFTKWVRGKESLTLHDPRPFPQDLKVIGLGKSVPGDVKAEVIVVTSWDDFDLYKEQMKGKIVCYSVEWQGYDKTVAYRSAGAIQAAKYGAVGALVRSVTPFSIESPHTGVTNYSDDYPKIPFAAISVEDANMFLRMRERGQKIVVHLKLENETIAGANSSNVIAEIRGEEFPDEIILFGGHMDSWDTGSQTGANDDGGGFITCFEALRAIKMAGYRPKRTLRFIGWSGEEYGENDSGAQQYVDQRQGKMGGHVLAFESDLGSNKPYGFGFTGSNEATQLMQKIITQSFGPINCTQINVGDGTMVDTTPEYELGIPTMRNLVQDFDDENPYYFTFHHSAGDSMDIMNPDNMDLNVIAIASMMYIVSDLDQRLPSDQ